MSLYATYNNEQLLQLLQTSDHGAFTEIYHRYWKRMLAMAHLRLENNEAAEDIVQDIFTTLWLRREGLSVQSLENWLATAVKYKIITFVNRQLKKDLSLEDISELSFNDNSVDIHFIEKLVNEEINKLPEKCRLVFKYSREEGLTNKEIASRLDISEKAVEKHITSARRQLSLTLRQLLQSLF